MACAMYIVNMYYTFGVQKWVRFGYFRFIGKHNSGFNLLVSVSLWYVCVQYMWIVVSLARTYIPDNEMWEPWFLHPFGRDLAGVRKRMQDNPKNRQPAPNVRTHTHTVQLYTYSMHSLIESCRCRLGHQNVVMSFYYLTFHYTIACCAIQTT